MEEAREPKNQSLQEPTRERRVIISRMQQLRRQRLRFAGRNAVNDGTYENALDEVLEPETRER